MTSLLSTVKIVITAVFGLSFGSFLNVVIARLPLGKSIASPPSQCPHCKAIIRWWQNIPLISYILLKGRCSNCNKAISIVYPFVELLTGLLLVLLYINFDWSPVFLFYSILVLFLIPIAIIDFRHFLIYDVLTIPGAIAGIIFAGTVDLSIITITQSLIGAGVGISFLFIMRLIGNFLFKKDTMGLGDIKLAGLIGVFLGWDIIILSIFLAAVMIVLVALILKISNSKMEAGKFPFGTYLSTAAIINLFWGDQIIRAYLTMIFQNN
ncbi:MAG: prepilin peptidase [Candidatus Marinimicrobia bacterium]|nr:prepilin peptidase [Candidatus Neomarinimicrobiota bacterium]